MRFLALLLGAALLGRAAAGDFVGLDPTATLPQPARQGVERIHATALRDHIAWLSAPEREGRGAGSRGLAAATEYVVSQLQEAGVQPVPGASASPDRQRYFQEVPAREIREPGGDVTLTLPGATRTAQAGAAAVLPQIRPQTIEAQMIFAGFGIREPALGHDDFDGLDVRGRIVVFISGVPPGPEWQRAELRERYAAARPDDRYEARLELLETLGARAGIAVEEDLPARMRAGKEPLEPYFLAAADAPAPSAVPLARVMPQTAQAVIARTGFDASRPREYRAMMGADASAIINVTGTARSATGRNALGYLPGRDPQLRSEAVVIGAHLDHLGRRGGVLHPGADDNASGVAALLEMARAFAASAMRPRRSVVFAFWTGEEAGQLDSSHYVRNPLWPLARTTVYINLDMIAHPWNRTEIEKLVRATNPQGAAKFLAQATPENFAEPGVANFAPWLATPLAAAGQATGMTLHFDWTDGKNGGSDYRAFARQGVPFIRFFGNFFPGYHEPGDTLENLDPDQVQRMARLVFATAWLIADAPPTKN